MSTSEKKIKKQTMRTYFKDGTIMEWWPSPSETESFTYPSEDYEYIWPQPYPDPIPNQWHYDPYGHYLHRIACALEGILKELKRIGCRERRDDHEQSGELSSEDKSPDSGT